MKSARTMIRTLGAVSSVLVIFAFLLYPIFDVKAAFTERINYQGKLADDNGVTVADGLYNMEFKLYDALSGGSNLWTETWSGGNKVQVTDGLFSVELGTTTALATVDFNQDLWLSINIGGTGTPSWDGEMSPRKKLTSVPSAYLAKKALSLDATYATTTYLYVTGTSTLGSIGIGTTSPQARLALTGFGAGTGKALIIADSSNSEKFIVRDDGTVSLDTTSTNQKLNINGNIALGASNYLTSYQDNSNYIMPFETTTGRMVFRTNAVDRLSILYSNGNVGIGTTSPYAKLSVAGDFALTGGFYDNNSTQGTSGMVLQTTGSGVAWVATSTLGLGGAGSADSLQTAYNTGATIETTAGTPVVITETAGSAMTHDLLQLTASSTTGGTFSGDALQITLDGADADSNTGNGLHMIVDQSQVTGNPILIEDDAGVDLFAVAESGGVTVGSQTARAGVDIYGALTNKGYKKSLGISGIIDVFIYDTTRDSDSGRWRLQSNSEYKSWYTEAKDDAIGDACVPATDDRCGTSLFPSKAVIAATADSVYIFDANTNSLWMKFSQNAAGYALGVDTNNNPSGIGALNGTIYVGTNGASGTGLYAFDFVNDRLYNYDATDRSQGDKNIANRNTAVAYATDNQTSYAIANNVVNDVHAQVLTQSGPAVVNTGTIQGKTFVAVATDASASVIHVNAARTIDYADGAATDDINQVWLTSRGRLYLTNETLAQVELYTAVDADTADQNAPDDVYDEQTANQPNVSKTAPTFATTPDALQVLERVSFADSNYSTTLGTVNSTPGGDIVYVGHSGGLSELHTVGAPSTAILGWSKFYTITGQTALMSGTPRAMLTMNDASGDVTDATIRNNVFEAKGTPTYRVDGVHDMGMSFNGTNQYLCSDANNDATCDTDADFYAGLLGFTVEAWFKHSTSISGIDTLIDHSFTTTPGASAGYRVWMDASGLMQARIDDDTTFGDEDPLSSPAGKSYADGQWHHIVFMRTSTAFAAPNPPVAVGIYMFIDGVMVASDTTIAATGTLTGTAITAIGADCSVGAACSTGANFWDGQIDDVYISMGGATTSDSPNAAGGAIARKYGEGRAAMLRSSTQITDATTVSSNTLGDSGASYIPNQFVGSIVEITGGTGLGQTRKVVSNTTTTLTVSPSWTVTPDTTSDYEIMPEQIYGGTNSVTSIGATDTDPLNTNKTLYIGASNGSDAGGVTVLSGLGTPFVSDVYHADSAFADDNGTAWSGTDYDDIMSIDVRSGVEVFGATGNLWMRTQDRILEESIDLLLNSLATVRQELLGDPLLGSSLSAGGADLAELYGSTEDLQQGEIVALDSDILENVVRSTSAYQRDVIGIVATRPGLVLGPTTASTTYPIALVGRVPVKVTTENGMIKAGDRITASSKDGYGMRATHAGRVLGTALEDINVENLVSCSDEGNDSTQCGEVLVFVNLVDYSGMSPLLLAREQSSASPACSDDESTSTTTDSSICEDETVEATSGALLEGLSGGDNETDALEILAFLNAQEDSGLSSEIFTQRLSAALDVITPKIYTNTLAVGSIESSSDDGSVALVLGDNGRFEIRAQTDPEDPSATTSPLITFDAQGNAVFSGTISAGGFVFGDVSATTSEDAQEDMPASFIESVEERVLNAIALIRSAVVRSFTTVALYAENMFAATITVVPDGRVILPAGQNQISGTARIQNGASSVDVENSAVLSTSKIFITPLSLTEHPLIVTLKRPGIGFTVSMFAPAALDIYFDWLIVDSYPTDDTTTSVPGETVVEDEPIEEDPEPPAEETISEETPPLPVIEEDPLPEPDIVPEPEPIIEEVLPETPQEEPETPEEEPAPQVEESESAPEPENEPVASG